MSDSLQRYGVFLNVENPDGDARSALRQSVQTAVLAEALGYHDVWVAEHHYSQYAIGSALMVLLAQIAAATSTIRIGSGASLLPLNDPLRVAEDIATLDLLSGGRIEFGVARGGPFPEQYRPSGLPTGDIARARMLEALALIRRLWSEPVTSFTGRFFQCDQVAIYPRPLQQPVPVWLASQSADSLLVAAEHGDGLMATPSADLARVAEQMAAERQRRGPFPFAIARFFHCEPDHQRAVAHGVACVRAYPRLMQVQFANGGTPPMFAADAPEEVILANAIIGDPAHCAAQVRRLQEQLGPHRLLLKPAVHEAAATQTALQLFARETGLRG